MNDEELGKWFIATLMGAQSIPSPPISAETKQGLDFIAALESFSLGDTLYGFVPSRIGTSHVVDTAARAVTYAQQYMLARENQAGQNHAALALAAYRNQGHAITTLPASLDASDASLMACVLLSLFDSIMDYSRPTSHAHAAGLMQVLLARGREQEASEFARAALYSNRYFIFHQPVAVGVASSFDDGRWSGLEWVCPFQNPRPEEAVLRRLGNDLFIRLPRLIAAVRGLRESASVVDADVEAVATLATELLTLTNKDAETKLLHRVKIVPSADPQDRRFVPYAIEYESPEQWEAAVLYWEARLILLRLCHTLSSLHPATTPAALQSAQQREHQRRAATNILMSWPYVRTSCTSGTTSRIAKALAVSWGALGDLETWHGVAISDLCEWILSCIRRTSRSSGLVQAFQKRDMEDVDDLLSGGPLREVRGYASKSGINYWQGRVEARRS